MDFRNTTSLDSSALKELFLRHTIPYRHDKIIVRVCNSRGADFSGRCFYRESRLTINLGRHNRYPYTLGTHVARAQSNKTHWWRDVYRLTVANSYQLALFVYLHELFHYLVKAAGRTPGRKEAMCDRFATRVLVDQYACPITDGKGAPVSRETWDFKDLHAFVAGAPREPLVVHAARRVIPIVPISDAARDPVERPTQLELGF